MDPSDRNSLQDVLFSLVLWMKVLSVSLGARSLVASAEPTKHQSTTNEFAALYRFRRFRSFGSSGGAENEHTGASKLIWSWLQCNRSCM